jgi:hypothetical protein
MNRDRSASRTAKSPPWHDWRFELVPRGVADDSTAPSPRRRASAGDGRADRTTEAGPETHPDTPRHDSMPTPGGEPMTTTIRSRRVRRILRLEGQADRQAAREARAAARATLLQRRVDALRTEARALEASLNGTQRAELGRARACPAPMSPTPPAPRTSRGAGDGPRCPVMHGEAAAGIAATPEAQEG